MVGVVRLRPPADLEVEDNASTLLCSSRRGMFGKVRLWSTVSLTVTTLIRNTIEKGKLLLQINLNVKKK